MEILRDILGWVAGTPVYGVALAFVAAYPIFTGVLWTFTSIIFYRRNERSPFPAQDEHPLVSIVVAAYCEEAVIDSTLDALLSLEYSNYEVIVIDDGSPDRTAEKVKRWMQRDDRLRLVEKRVNEGKAIALNDAIPVTQGEIVVVIDADIRPRPDVVGYMVGHFRHGRVAAVATRR